MRLPRGGRARAAQTLLLCLIILFTIGASLNTLRSRKTVRKAEDLAAGCFLPGFTPPEAGSPRASITVTTRIRLLPWQPKSVQADVTLRPHRRAPAPVQRSDQAWPDLPRGRLPKVALMFLTRGELPHEPIWRAFLRGLPELAGGWETLFSIYVHSPPGHSYPEGSLFHGREIANRVKVDWGSFMVVQAERALIAAALGDAANQRFVLLSESCLPLYPAPVVWAQLTLERKSRIDACPVDDWDPDDRLMSHRWQEGMLQEGVQKHMWRKSSQWFAINRRHALLVAYDSMVCQAFARECWVDWSWEWEHRPRERFCINDEHFIPTLIAFHDEGNSTDCKGQVTFTMWDTEARHPKTWGTDKVTANLVAGLRRAPHRRDAVTDVPLPVPGCRPETAIASARAVFMPLAPHRRDLQAPAQGLFPSAVGALMRGLDTKYQALDDAECPLFARKFTQIGRGVPAAMADIYGWAY